jgi:NADH-quinone oxidoreductase subunit J
MVEITLFVFQTIALFSMIYLTNLRNPIHSVFLLILVFANVGGILLILAVEFLAIVYIIVYLGAIAVLFLFVIMMLDIKLSPVSDKKFYYAPVAVLITFVIATECAYVLEASIPEASFLGPIYTSFSVLLNENQLEQLSLVLFLFLTVPFFLVALVLLIALIGAIVLTISEDPETKHQEVAKQLNASTLSIRALSKRLGS